MTLEVRPCRDRDEFAEALTKDAAFPKRMGRPDEVARVVEFLADPESGYITGQVFGVNGGLYM